MHESKGIHESDWRSMKLHYLYVNGDKQAVLRGRNKPWGRIIQDNDGYFYWWQEDGTSGSVPALALKELAYILDTLNAPWDMIIQNDPVLDRKEL